MLDTAVPGCGDSKELEAAVAAQSKLDSEETETAAVMAARSDVDAAVLDTAVPVCGDSKELEAAIAAQSKLESNEAELKAQEKLRKKRVRQKKRNNKAFNPCS